MACIRIENQYPVNDRDRARTAGGAAALLFVGTQGFGGELNMGAEGLGGIQTQGGAIELPSRCIGLADNLAVAAMELVRVRCIFVPRGDDDGLVVAGI